MLNNPVKLCGPCAIGLRKMMRWGAQATGHHLQQGPVSMASTDTGLDEVPCRRR